MHFCYEFGRAPSPICGGRLVVVPQMEGPLQFEADSERQMVFYKNFFMAVGSSALEGTKQKKIV